MKFKDIVSIANNVKSYVEKQDKLPAKIDGVSKADYSYLFTKSVLNPGKDITLVHYKEAPNPKGDTILKTFTKKEYTDIAKDINKFLSNKRFPNYDTYQNKKISIDLIIYCFAKIISFYGKNKRVASTCKFDSSVFKSKKAAPTIKPNDTWNYFVKKTGFKGTTIDEVLAYVKKYGKYQYYFNGHKPNKQVTDCKCGNCTDWLQWLINIAEALGYEWKCIHVKCIKSGTGHVRGQFKHSKHTGGAWINRDPAAVADGGSITSIWCGNGVIIDKNPSWFMETLRK